MKNLSFTLASAVCLWIGHAPGKASAAPAGVAGEYRIVESSKPGGGGGYRGKLDIEAQGAAYKLNWTLESGEAYSGPAILVNGVLGAGYGDGLTGLAVYEIKGGTLKAKWLLPANPEQVGDYELTGPASLNGFYKFTNGMSGGVSIKPKGKVYNLVWTLPSGSFPGIAVKVNDVLVAVSGKPGGNYGIAAYLPVGSRVVGIWTVPGQSALGSEILAPAAAAAPPAPAEKSGATTSAGDIGFNAAGTEVRFAGETYHLADGSSAPGKPTSELREYLLTGETFDNYSKMVALRVQNPSGADALAFTRLVLQHVKKSSPDAETNEIEHTAKSATMEFLLVNGADAEYNFWHYFQVPQGLASVQFVLRNKPPFETKEKFKAERVAHFDTWVQDAKTLAPQVSDALVKTTKPAAGGANAPAAPSETKADPPDDALVGKIQADLQIAGGIAGNFLELLKANKLSEAAALVSDEGLSQMKTTRKDFLAKLQQSQATDGRMLSFAPNKDKLDFGPESGGIYFVLEADSKCEKTAAHEKLRFFRFPDGKVKMVGYQHTK